MKIKEMTIRYDEKRSKNFQTAGVGMEMTVTMEEGDRKDVVFAAAMKHMKNLVGAECDAAIKDLCWRDDNVI